MSYKRSTNGILDIPNQIRWSMPYMVHAQWPSRSEQSQSAMVEVLGREYDVLHIYRADRLRKPSPSMFRLWAESKSHSSGWDAEDRLGFDSRLLATALNGLHRKLRGEIPTERNNWMARDLVENMKKALEREPNLIDSNSTAPAP